MVFFVSAFPDMAGAGANVLASHATCTDHHDPKSTKRRNQVQGRRQCRRKHGFGSENKPKPPTIVTGESPSTLRAHVMEVPLGRDVAECVARFAMRLRRSIYVLSAGGCLTNVTLRRPGGGVVTLYGQFEILTLVGCFFFPTLAAAAPNAKVASPEVGGGLTAYLAGSQGQVVGGSAAVGGLVAAGPVVVVLASFVAAAFDRLPLPNDEDLSQRCRRRCCEHAGRQR